MCRLTSPPVPETLTCSFPSQSSFNALLEGLILSTRSRIKMDKNTHISRVYLYIIYVCFGLLSQASTKTPTTLDRALQKSSGLQEILNLQHILTNSNSAIQQLIPELHNNRNQAHVMWAQVFQVLPIVLPIWPTYIYARSTVSMWLSRTSMFFGSCTGQTAHWEQKAGEAFSKDLVLVVMRIWNRNMSMFESPYKSIKLRLAEFSSHFCCHVEMVGNYCWWKDIYLIWYHCHHAFIVWEPIPSGCLWLVARCLHSECPCSKRSWADIGSEVKMPSMTICLFEEMVSSRLFNADGLPILIGAYGVLLLLGQASHESP